jgi:hypothetical protein
VHLTCNLIKDNSEQGIKTTSFSIPPLESGDFTSDENHFCLISEDKVEKYSYYPNDHQIAVEHLDRFSGAMYMIFYVCPTDDESIKSKILNINPDPTSNCEQNHFYE